MTDMVKFIYVNEISEFGHNQQGVSDQIRKER